jgi:YHS domain-containing protein
MALCLTTAAIAAEYGTQAAAPAKSSSRAKTSSTTNEVLNNVVKMDAQGSRTALCCCGAEVTVADDTPTLDRNGTHFYFCGQGCRDAAEKASKAESAKTMKSWRKKFSAYKLASNAYQKDGKELATCLCGKTVEVTKSTPSISENGVTLYLCSTACKTALHGASPEDRLGKEMAMLKDASGSPDPTASASHPQ